MGKGIRTVVAATVLLLPTSLNAQTAWDSPLLMPPNPSDGLGIYLTDMHHGGVGVMGTWRSSTWNYGLRAGISDGYGNEDLAVFAGVDYAGPINTASQDFPLDIDWVFGAGIAVTDGVLLSAPLGLSLGHSFQGETARFTPFLTPRVVLDAWFGDGDDDMGLDLAVDLGLDMRLTGAGGPLNGTTIRFAATVGDREALAIGLVF